MPAGKIEITTLYGRDNQKPLVQIVLEPPIAQLEPEQVFEIVLQLLEASQSTLTDGFLVEWMRQERYSERHVWAMLTSFRQWREARVGGRVETAAKFGLKIQMGEEPIKVAQPPPGTQVVCGFCELPVVFEDYIRHDINAHDGLNRVREFHATGCKIGCVCRIQEYEAVAATMGLGGPD